MIQETSGEVGGEIYLIHSRTVPDYFTLCQSQKL